MEQRLKELLELADQILTERRAPTEEERNHFLALKAQVQGADARWRGRFNDLVDRFAAALEGVGL